MDKKIILGFVGEIASGKGTACEYFVKNYSAISHRFSSILRNILNIIFLPHSRENMQKLSSCLRETFSDEILAQALTESVKNDPNKLICVDGIRRPADIKFLKNLPNFYLIHISADETIRYERIIKRNENLDDNNKTFAEFQNDQKREAELQILDVAKQANYKVLNNSNFEDLYKQLDQVLKTITNK